MALSNGCNHVTIVTQDIERLISFYVEVFDAEVTLDLEEGGLRHALIDLGGGFCLHPFQIGEDAAHSKGKSDMFQRGHIDHFALNFEREADYQEARRRLVERRATNGRERDFGMVRIVTFSDPDGMECELGLWQADRKPLTMEQSRTVSFENA